MNLKRLARGPAIWIVLAVLILWLGASSFMTTGIQRIDTSDGLALLAGDTVEQARIVDGQQRVDLVLTEPFEDKGERVQFYYVEPQGPTVVAALEGADLPGGYDSEVPQTSWWVSILSLVIPFVIILGLFWFFMSRMQGGGSRVMQFGKSRAKLVSKEKPQVTFADVAGVDEAVEELQEIKEFLADPAKFQAVGAKIPKGVLLYGQPGTGKTLLARAVAGEAGVPFYSISGSDFVEMF
ncbi:MAG: AAA family ATPase, partial [Actinomycetales bacterium]|nr:AAA family ATPase [Actinomycetales bacterium]